MSILIRGGRVVTAADDYVADVFIEGERIALIGADLDATADRTIDASGRYVLPGCIDDPVCLDVELLADQGDPLVLDEDVRDVVVGRGDDPASSDQRRHLYLPPGVTLTLSGL